LITDTMKQLIANHIQSTLANNGKIGLGGNSTYSTQTGLDVDLGTLVSLSATVSDENVVEVHLTISGNASGMSNSVIREAGIFDSAGNLLVRHNFDGLGPFSTTENLELFFIMEVE